MSEGIPAINVKARGAEGGLVDASPIIQKALAEAAVVWIDEGIYRIGSTIDIPSNKTVTGVGSATLVLDNDRGILRTRKSAENVQLESISFDGRSRPMRKGKGLVLFDRDGRSLSLRGCHIRRSTQHGVVVFEAEAVVQNATIEDIARKGIKVDSTAPVIVEGNTVRRCGSTGISISGTGRPATRTRWQTA